MKIILFFITLTSLSTFLFGANHNNPLLTTSRDFEIDYMPPSPPSAPHNLTRTDSLNSLQSPNEATSKAPANSPNLSNQSNALTPRSPSQAQKTMPFYLKILPAWLHVNIKKTLSTPTFVDTHKPQGSITNTAITTLTSEQIYVITCTANTRKSTQNLELIHVVLIYNKKRLVDEPSYKYFKNEDEATKWTILHLQSKEPVCGCC